MISWLACKIQELNTSRIWHFEGQDGSKTNVLRLMVTMMVLMVTVVIISSKKLQKESRWPPLIPSKDSQNGTDLAGHPPTHFVRVNSNSS